MRPGLIAAAVLLAAAAIWPNIMFGLVIPAGVGAAITIGNHRQERSKERRQRRSRARRRARRR